MNFNPALPVETLAVLEQVDWDAVTRIDDVNDPFVCQVCHRSSATVTVTFTDGKDFEVCDACRIVAGALVTVGPLLAAEPVHA